MEEAGGKALRGHEMVARRGHRPEVHGMFAPLLVLRDTYNLHPMKNITAFLMNQNRQFDDVVRELTYVRDSLDGARYILIILFCLWTHMDPLLYCRLRNHDLLTSLDVLTTGSYRRLPTMIKVRRTTRVRL